MAKKPAAKPKPTKPKAVAKPAKQIVQTLNVNAPGKTYPRDKAKYEAARAVFLKVMPSKGPGVTQSEMMAMMKKAMPKEFGTTTGWWTKTVQLDAEARGEVTRDGGKPLRWKKKS
jgi:hypothetical protein